MDGVGQMCDVIKEQTDVQKRWKLKFYIIESNVGELLQGWVKNCRQGCKIVTTRGIGKLKDTSAQPGRRRFASSIKAAWGG